MGIMNFDFLNDIEIDEKPEYVKSIRFNERETHLIKFPLYLNKNFGRYVKQLIEEDLRKFSLQAKEEKVNVIDKTQIRSILMELLDEKDIENINLNLKQDNKVSEKKENIDDEMLTALNDLGIGIR